jgi:hypothetical protein
MNRVKSFDATGIAPGGRLYPGDLNSIQDAAAALVDFSQTVKLGSVAIGESASAFSLFLSGVVRLTAALQIDQGLLLGTMTTTERDAIGAGEAPKGTVIYNETLNTVQVNVGSDGARNWASIGDLSQSIADAKGDLVIATAADTLTRIAVGADGTVLTADSGQSKGAKWAPPSLSSVSGQLTGDVTMANANQFYDGPSVSLAAGTWLLNSTVTFDGVSGQELTAKLWDGTTVAAAAQMRSGSSQLFAISLTAIVSPGTTTTYKVSMAANSTGFSIKASPSQNGTGCTNKASTLTGIRIA